MQIVTQASWIACVKAEAVKGARAIPRAIH
jgi:hypothetical protein